MGAALGAVELTAGLALLVFTVRRYLLRRRSPSWATLRPTPTQRVASP